MKIFRHQQKQQDMHSTSPLPLHSYDRLAGVIDTMIADAAARRERESVTGLTDAVSAVVTALIVTVLCGLKQVVLAFAERARRDALAADDGLLPVRDDATSPAGDGTGTGSSTPPAGSEDEAGASHPDPAPCGSDEDDDAPVELVGVVADHGAGHARSCLRCDGGQDGEIDATRERRDIPPAQFAPRILLFVDAGRAIRPRRRGRAFERAAMRGTSHALIVTMCYRKPAPRRPRRPATAC